MEVLIEVVNQKLRLASNLKSFAPHSQKFIKFRFELSSDWDELTILAQFRQNDVAYNVYLEGDNTVYLPNEIKEGKCTLMLYGSKDTIIGTTNCLTLLINDNKFLTEAESTTMSQSLYDKLLAQIQVELDEAKNELTAQNVTEYNIAINNLTSENSTQLNNSIDELERSNAANIATTKTQLENQINTQISSATNSLSTQITSQINSAKSNLSAQITSELNDAKTEILSALTYTVTWYSLPNKPIYSATVKQYEEAVYIGDLPKNTTEECNGFYNVFVGWDKSTGCVTSDMEVYAIWERGSSNEIGSKQLNELNCAELYGLCTQHMLHFYYEDKDYIDIQLGHNFSFSNVESSLLCENTFFDGTNAFLSSETIPTNKSFTLAIDFEFLGDTTNTYILDWYDTSSKCSIRLKLNYDITLSINGSSFTKVAYSRNRRTIVIRYNKYFKKFYTYSYDGSSYNLYGDSIQINEYNQGSKTIPSTPICFGGTRSSDKTSITSCSHGWIHWCKLWEDDLGENVCKILAAHPRTTMRMEYIGEDRYTLNEVNGETSGASFLSNNLLSLQYNMNDAATNIDGWYNCKMRKFLNTRIFSAFPYKWQAIIKPVNIQSGKGGGSTGCNTSRDYIYIPSSREVGGANTAAPYANEGKPISYLTTNKSRVKTLFIIDSNAQFIESSTDPTQNNPNGIAEGTIWINGNKYYYYFTDNSHDCYGKIIAFDGGLWIPSQTWSLRSPHTDAQSYLGVYIDGTPRYLNSPADTGRYIAIGFSV